MTPERWQEVKKVLAVALERLPGERGAFLDGACGTDAALKAEVKSLLAADEPTGPVDEPAGALLPPLVSPSQTPTVPLEVPATTRYQELEKLGGGGMGVVYKARDVWLDRTIVLKFLPPYLSSDEEARKRFVVEAQSAAALEHPNICTIHEIGEAPDGQLFIAMPFYEGETLEEKIGRGPLPIEDAVNFAVQLSRGLAKAHERGIVHRDVKPANVMVTTDGLVKILDFGIAKLADVHLTRTGVMMGTVAYMSPEQACGDPVDHRTDIWSLGVVLYEMVTGVHPFRGDHESGGVLYAILTRDPEPLTTLRAEAPPVLEEIARRALAKDREKRHESVRSLGQELQSVAASRRTVAALGAVRKAARNRQEAQPGLLPEGERRQTTIVVLHLASYTALVEQLVSEEVEHVMSQIRDLAREIVERHGGVVNEFTGDTMILLFGVPTTHEDDSVRAVRAALELIDRVRSLSKEVERRGGEEICYQAGITSGCAVVQSLHGDHRKYRVLGDVVQAATKLAAHAEPGDVLVGQGSHRIIAPYFRTEPLAQLPGTRGAEPITPSRVVGESGLQTRLEAAARTGLTAYTGRANKLATLRECLESALHGDGQFVTVMGEAGLGKSRLLYEFRQILDRDHVRVLGGRCQSYGGSTSYLPFIEALRQALRLDEPAPQADQVERAVTAIRGIDPQLEQFIPIYLHLLSISSDEFPLPKHLQSDLFRFSMVESLSAIVTLAAKRRPVVMLLEDWHWVDDASHEVLKQLVEMVSTYPLLLVVTYRPGDPLDWGSAAHHTAIHLEPLEPSSSLEIIQSVLGANSVSDELGVLLHERTAGNPFFLEEICQTLSEEGTVKLEEGVAVVVGTLSPLHLPDTVQGVIRTRIDRLDRGARETLRLASVVGREFTRPILHRVFPDETGLLTSLETLKASGLIQQVRVLPDPTYRFKHVLTQEVTYDSLLERQRKEFHGVVGAAIEELYPDRSEEDSDVLARHFSAAEDWRRAVHYGRASAQRATALGQVQEALNILERTQGWLLRLPDDADRREQYLEFLLRQEGLSETVGLRARQQRIIDELLSLLGSADDRARLADVYRRQGDLYRLLRKFDEAERELEKALRISRQLSDVVAERNCLRSMVFLEWHWGKHQEALERAEAALAIDRRRGNTDAVLSDLVSLGSILNALGNYAGALSALEEALELAERVQNPFQQHHVLHNIANVHLSLGDKDRALAYLQRGKEMGGVPWFRMQHCWHLLSIAHIYLEQGRVEDGLELYHEAVVVARDSGGREALSQSLRVLGEVLFSLDRHAEALPYLRESATLFAQLESHTNEALMLRNVALICERQRNGRDAVKAWEGVRELSRVTGSARGELEAVEGMARVARQLHASAAPALEQYRAALALAEKIGDAAKAAELLNAMGILQWTEGEYDLALEHYERALRIFGALDDRVHAGLMLNSIGVTLRKLGRTREAAARLDEAIQLNQENGQRLLEAHGSAALGDIHYDHGSLNDARRCYERSLALRREIGDRPGEGWMLYHLARVHSSQAASELAREYAAQAMAIAAECENVELLNACQRMRG